MNKKYYAFISYSHKDLEMAKWLQHEFEYYELPTNLFESRTDICRENLPKSFRPIFRDEDELSGGNLKPQITEALSNSEYLIVICSPNSATSEYVDSEIREFINLSPDNKRRIFPYIIDGEPHQDEKHSEKECFSKTLLELSNDKTNPLELIAGDIKATGRDHAFVKILAGTLKEKNIRFADLWDRYAIEKAEMERKEREDKERLQIIQSRFISEKAVQLVEEGDSYTARFLALKALPNSFDNPDRPIVPEAEMVLRLANQYETTLFRHRYDVMHTSISPDDKLIATVTDDKCIYIWSLNDGRQIHKLEGNLDVVNYLSFNSNGNKLVSASGHKRSRAYSRSAYEDFSIRIWDVNTGKETHKLEGHSRSVKFARFCKNDEWIISSSDDNTIRIWDVKTGKEINKIENCILIEQHSKTVIAEYSYDSIKWWHPECPDRKYKVLWHEGEIPKLMDLNRNTIVSTSLNHSLINLWDIHTGSRILSLEGHTWGITDLKLSPDGKLLISTSTDNSVRIWDIDKGIELKCFNITSWGRSVAFSNNGKSFIFSDNGFVYLKNKIDNYDLGTLDGHYFLSGNSVDLCSKGNQLIVADRHAIKIYDINYKTETSRIKVPRNVVCNTKYSPKGEYIIASLDNKTIQIWDTINPENTIIINDFGPYEVVETNNDKGLIIAVLKYEYINIWKCDNNAKLLHQIPTYRKSICTAINSDKMTIAAVHEDGYIQFFDLLSGEESHNIKTNIQSISTVTFNNTGNLLACASFKGHNIYVINAETGIEYCHLNGHQKHVSSIKWNKDDKYILTASHDKTIRVWDSVSGSEIFKHEMHSKLVEGAYFHHSDQMIVSYTQEGEIKFLNFQPLQTLAEITRERFKSRELTPEECRKYYIE